MKVEIPAQLVNEIKDFIENGSNDDALAFALVENVYQAIEDEKKAYEAYVEDLTDSIQM